MTQGYITALQYIAIPAVSMCKTTTNIYTLYNSHGTQCYLRSPSNIWGILKYLRYFHKRYIVSLFFPAGQIPGWLVRTHYLTIYLSRTKWKITLHVSIIFKYVIHVFHFHETRSFSLFFHLKNSTKFIFKFWKKKYNFIAFIMISLTIHMNYVFLVVIYHFYIQWKLFSLQQ